MSRCFPFPPPGYEGKHKLENLDLLKEAKRKEKKHKREKKDKEKKKDREKEKDVGNEKHRKEKHKDKKDKHKDKKKDKEERVKEKEKSSISEELAVAGKVKEQSGDKLHPKAHIIQSQNGGKPLQSSLLPSQGIEDSKFVQELNRRNQDEKKGRLSQLPEKVAPVDRMDQDTAAIATVKSSSVVRIEETDDYKNNRVDRKIDPQGLGRECSGNTIFPNANLLSQSKVEKISRPVDGQNGRRLQDRQKSKETYNVNQGHKPKDKESHGREKERKKKDGEKVKSENIKPEQGQLKDDVRNNPGGIMSNAIRSPVLLNNNAANEANIRKRKDMDANGFLHDHEIRPNKILKPDPHQLAENGRKPEGIRTPSKPPPDKHVIHNSFRVEKRDPMTNGVVEAQRPSPSKPTSSVPTVARDQIAEGSKPPPDSKILNKSRKVPDVEDQIAEASRRPPHPDSKYLAEILTVPNMAEWAETDDQDWLFSKKGPLNKPNTEPTGVEEDQHVWSEAVHVESAAVYALPYVIPY